MAAEFHNSLSFFFERNEVSMHDTTMVGQFFVGFFFWGGVGGGGGGTYFI